MRILITGASSLPGFRTALEALSRGYSVLGVFKEHPIPIDHDKLIKIRLDIRDFDKLKSVFNEYKPDVIIHMAALGDVDLCERDKNLAWDINVFGTLNIVHLASKYSDFLLYLSTDYVFDGERGNYGEHEPPNPINYYGLTKLMGEVACLSSQVPTAVVRSSSIYGLGPGRKNFAKFLIENLSRGKRVKVLVDQHTSPTEATLLGKAIVEIVERKLEGIFHVVGERMSRYEFALKVAKTLDLNESLIAKAKMGEMAWYARRPRDSSLSFENTRMLLRTNFYSTDVALQVLRSEYHEQRDVT